MEGAAEAGGREVGSPESEVGRPKTEDRSQKKQNKYQISNFKFLFLTTMCTTIYTMFTMSLRLLKRNI